MLTSLRKIMEADPLHEKSTNSKRAARRLILHYCDTQSLLALRLVSKDFKIWTKTEERRYFRDIRITLNLTGDFHIPYNWETLGQPGKIAERIIFTFVVNGAGRRIEFKQRHESEGGNVERYSTLNPLPKEGHFDTCGQFSLIEPSIPILGGVFQDFDDNLFKRILDMTPNVRSLCIRDCVERRPEMDTDWGRTLVDEALIYLRCQLEDLLLDRLEDHSRLEEVARYMEVDRLKEVAQLVESPITHLDEMIRLAAKLRLNELFQLKQRVGLTESPFMRPKVPEITQPKRLLARPKLLNWLREMAEITGSPSARLKELALLVESPPALFEENLRIAEMLRLEEKNRLEELFLTTESTSARLKLQARAERLALLEESLPGRLELLAQLEELAILAENTEDRRGLRYKLERYEGLLTAPPEDLARFAGSLEGRLSLRARLAKLARPLELRLLEMQVSSPLALWHFRTFPGYGNGGNSLQGVGVWATIKTLNITLPDKTPGNTPGRRRTVKKAVYDFLAAFSKQVETLGIGFRSNAVGETTSENPLTYDSDPEFGGGGEKTMYPALKKLRLANMRLIWAGGMREFLTERAPNCINVELSGVRFAKKDDWHQLYQMFTLESPEKKTRALVLVRKLELLSMHGFKREV